MPTIKNTMQLYDLVSGPAQKMISTIHSVVDVFQTMEDVSGASVNVAAIQDVRDNLAALEADVEGVTADLRAAADQQENLNNNIQRGTGAADGLLSTVKGIAATIGGLAAVKQLVGLSDTVTNTNARLNLIVDDGGSVEDLKQKIMASAQRSRAEYLNTAEAVSQMGLMAGDAFANNDELIQFTETLNKQFAIAGTSSQGISAATLQLTQAMASGVLRGEELNSVFENAPNVIHSIADYLDVPVGQIRSMAAEGQITADIVKNALLSATDDVNAQFATMPMTWAQVWTSMQNRAVSALQPVLNKINEIANSDRFQGFVNSMMNAFNVVVFVLTVVLDLVSAVGGAIYDNWSWIEPLVWGIVAALTAYYAVMGIVNTIQAISSGIKAFAAFQAKAHAAALAMETGATFAQTAAQYGLNAALYACPITWIVLAVIALIAVIVAVIRAMDIWGAQSHSVIGTICGLFMVAVAFIGNILVALVNFGIDIFVVFWNFIAAFANFFGNVFNDPVGSIARLFFDLVDTVLSLLQSLASAIDTLFGSNLAGAVQGWRDSLSGWVDETFGQGEEIMEQLSAEDLHLGRFEYGAAFEMGAEFGDGISDQLSGLFDFSQDIDPISEYDLDTSGIADNTGAIADNTGAMSDAMDYAEEDLQYLRDIAERDAINRFITAEIHIEQHNENHIGSDMDVDGIMDKWTEDFAERLDVSSEGVHE